MTEGHASRPHPETVVLELGDEVGALIVYAEPELHGSEIEISRHDNDNSRTHKDVLERSLAGRPVYAAVFDLLNEGTYTLWVDNAPRSRRIEVVAGRITELDWRIN